MHVSILKQFFLGSGDTIDTSTSKHTQNFSSTNEAPIDLLPTEIISRIFTFCFPDQGYSASPSISYAPILPGRISRRWREISLSTPELWTIFHLHLDDSQPLDASKAADLISAMDAWTARSGSLPLSLGLYCPTFGSSVHAMRQLVKNLISYSPRCRRFVLHLGQMRRRDHTRPYQGYPWFRLPSRTVYPYLEEVDLDLPFRDALAFLEPAINSTPRLRDITLAGTPPSLLTVLPHSTLGQLTDLRTTSVESVQGCCEILNLSPRLRNCRFDLRVSERDDVLRNVAAPILHRELDKLYVGPTDLEVFFDSVTLPSLQVLTINCAPQKGRWSQRSFLDFLNRSHCSLRKLSLFNAKLSSDFLTECLEAVSATLVELHIEGGQEKFITQSVLAALTCPPNDDLHPTNPVQAPLCPSLIRIRIRGLIFEADVTGAHVLDMLESRFRPSSRDNHLRWAFMGGSYNKNDWKRIEALGSDGLQLIVAEEGDDKYVPDYLGDPSLFDCRLCSPIRPFFASAYSLSSQGQ
ncbi:hypothetical protein H0H92_004130 [Tricholoma furcatifolium]|nr:hypothetical protein H0H92_004130 [Tricholoma furcatifolium]